MILPQHILYSPFGFRLGFSVINMAMNSVIKVEQRSGLLVLFGEQLSSCESDATWKGVPPFFC